MDSSVIMDTSIFMIARVVLQILQIIQILQKLQIIQILQKIHIIRILQKIHIIQILQKKQILQKNRILQIQITCQLARKTKFFLCFKYCKYNTLKLIAILQKQQKTQMKL